MAELLLDWLGVNAGPPVQGDKDDKKPKHRQVTNILEWIQCYTIYMAVRVEKHPEKSEICLVTKHLSWRLEWNMKGMGG